jgi:hypothetical protein
MRRSLLDAYRASRLANTLLAATKRLGLRILQGWIASMFHDVSFPSRGPENPHVAIGRPGEDVTLTTGGTSQNGTTGSDSQRVGYAAGR